MRSLIVCIALLTSSFAFATEVTPNTLVGKFSVQATVFFQKFYANLNVLNETEFELQRVYPNGSGDEICNGTFTLKSTLQFDSQGMAIPSKLFQGVATCPSDRTKTLDCDVDFATKTIEDLNQGTKLKIHTSMGGGIRLDAYVKKH